MLTRRLRKAAIPQQLVLGVLALLTIYPFFFMVSVSFKNNEQFFKEFWFLSVPLHLENYLRAFPRVLEFITNSLLYSIPTLLLTMIVSLFAGYAFARYRFRGRDALFLLMLSVLMLPGVLTLAPLFVQLRNWGWLNTPQAVIMPWTAVEVVFATLVMRLFFETQPKDLFEAARLDGASELMTLLRIALPLALPGLGVIAITNVLFTWNDIIWPLIVIFDRDKFPVAPGMIGFQGQYRTEYGPLFAGYVLASLPLILLFVVSLRRFIEGLRSSLVA